MPESTRIASIMQSLIVMARCVAVLLAATLAGPGARAAEGGEMASAQVNVSNVASLQRGARLYFNYCSGCHSIKYMSYSRLAEDLRLKPDEVLKSFAFTGARIGDQVVSNMPADGSQAWFGKTPPDLALMQAQHKSVMKQLKNGIFDDKIKQYLGAAPPDRPAPAASRGSRRP